MVKHVAGHGGEGKALNVGKNKQDQPVGPARGRGDDLRGQWDPFHTQLQWGIYDKTASP